MPRETPSPLLDGANKSYESRRKVFFFGVHTIVACWRFSGDDRLAGGKAGAYYVWRFEWGSAKCHHRAILVNEVIVSYSQSRFQIVFIFATVVNDAMNTDKRLIAWPGLAAVFGLS